jgi:Holliday junction resolvasome RuvABC ATP-dependent DNA helicase subunit
MKLFDNIVGQEGAKRKLAFYIQNYRKVGRIPHLLFVAEKGCGKTTMAKAVGQALRKYFIVINCSTIKDLSDFFQNYVKRYMFESGTKTPKQFTIVFDEASEIPKDLTMALLTILNPNAKGQNIFNFEGVNYVFDFTKHSFLFATTEPQRIFHALMDRVERVDLEPYSTEDLATIIRSTVKAYISDETITQIATVLRGNPRAAQKMADIINDRVVTSGIKELTPKHWESIKYTLDIKPLGVNNTELQILKILSEYSVVKLSHLAARMGMTVSAVQRHFENFLIRNGLIQVQPNGRSLTSKGREYIQALQRA